MVLEGCAAQRCVDTKGRNCFRIPMFGDECEYEKTLELN